MAKIHLQNLKILFFSRTTVPISAKLDIKDNWVKGLKFLHIKGHFNSQVGDWDFLSQSI